MRNVISFFVGILPIALFASAFYVPIKYADYFICFSLISLFFSVIFEIKTSKPKLFLIGQENTKEKHDKSKKIDVIEESIKSNSEISEIDHSLNSEYRIANAQDLIILKRNKPEDVNSRFNTNPDFSTFDK